MSKRYSSGGGFVKFIAVVVSIIIVLGAVLCGVYWEDVKAFFSNTVDKLNGNVSDEIPDDGVGVEGEDSATVDGFIVDTEETNGVSLAMTPLLASEYEENGVSAQAESAVTITATVLPEYATNKTLVWELSFVEPMSEDGAAWFTTWDTLGYTINDLVTVTVSEDTLSASVACMDAFGAQMQLKVSSQADTSVYAIVLLDYAVRIQSATIMSQNGPVAVNSYPMEHVGAFNGSGDYALSSSFSGDLPYTLSLTSSGGTYAKNSNIRVQITSDFYNYLQEQGFTMLFDSWQSTQISWDTFGSVTLNLEYSGLYFTDNTAGFEDKGSTAEFGNLSDSYLEKYRVAVNNYLDYCNENGGDGAVCKITFSYGENVNYPDTQYFMRIIAVDNYFEIAPTEITTDEEQVIF